MTFASLQLIEPLLRAISEEGYDTPTPIQERAIPSVLEGRDLLGCAQTGTGKTAAFALPILQRLSQRAGTRPGAIRTLVLAPTRELAAQIHQGFAAYGRHLRLGAAVIFGGVGQHGQEQALRRSPAVLVATPGRLLDLMHQRIVRLDAVEVLVLDEADRMLDMGFINDIRKVVAQVPARRQTLLFSATMPREIRELASGLMRDPIEVQVAAVSSTAETVAQSVFMVARPDKPALLRHLMEDHAVRRVLVFTRTKHGADKVARHLEGAGVGAAAIHGNKSQNARTRALEGFRAGSVRVLVASDIASRGLDVDGITHVVNYDLPNEPETYVHRIGRTGRAGAQGIAWSLCDGEERAFLRDIERLIRKPVPVIEDHPFRASAHRTPTAAPPASRGHHQGQQPRHHGGGHGQRQHDRGFPQRREGGGGGRLHQHRPFADAPHGAPRQIAEPGLEGAGAAAPRSDHVRGRPPATASWIRTPSLAVVSPAQNSAESRRILSGPAEFRSR